MNYGELKTVHLAFRISPAPFHLVDTHMLDVHEAEQMREMKNAN